MMCMMPLENTTCMCVCGAYERYESMIVPLGAPNSTLAHGSIRWPFSMPWCDWCDWDWCKIIISTLVNVAAVALPVLVFGPSVQKRPSEPGHCRNVGCHLMFLSYRTRLLETGKGGLKVSKTRFWKTEEKLRTFCSLKLIGKQKNTWHKTALLQNDVPQDVPQAELTTEEPRPEQKDQKATSGTPRGSFETLFFWIQKYQFQISTIFLSFMAFHGIMICHDRSWKVSFLSSSYNSSCISNRRPNRTTLRCKWGE